MSSFPRRRLWCHAIFVPNEEDGLQAMRMHLGGVAHCRSLWLRGNCTWHVGVRHAKNVLVEAYGLVYVAGSAHDVEEALTSPIWQRQQAKAVFVRANHAAILLCITQLGGCLPSRLDIGHKDPEFGQSIARLVAARCVQPVIVSQLHAIGLILQLVANHGFAPCSFERPIAGDSSGRRVLLMSEHSHAQDLLQEVQRRLQLGDPEDPVQGEAVHVCQ
mmetsp:Transcript_24099/g.45504  ORF Transcript_24099/g.45504 Transcript_24099/m.45504 type:complete len:217 (+) Transcript_24099:750-1400(+)